MELARIVGSVVASVKEPRLIGSKLLLAEPVDPSGEARPGMVPYVAVDLVGAGEGEMVLVVRGSPAARALEVERSPVDAAVVGIVDDVRTTASSPARKR